VGVVIGAVGVRVRVRALSRISPRVRVRAISRNSPRRLILTL